MDTRQTRVSKRFRILLILFIVLAITILGMVFMREFFLLRQNTSFFNEQVKTQAMEQIKLEVDSRVDEVNSVKEQLYEEYISELEDRVMLFDLSADYAVSQLPLTATLEEKRELYIQMAYNLNINNDESLFFVLDNLGNSYLSGLVKSMEGTNILDLQDEVTGRYFIQEMILALNAAETNDAVITYHWIKEVDGEHIIKTSYIYYNENVDLIIGSGMYDVDYQKSVQDELFNRISSYEYDLVDYIYIFNYDGEVIYHIDDDFMTADLLEIETTNGEGFHETIVAGLESKESLYIEYFFEFNDLNQYKTGYIKKIEDWNMYIGKSFAEENILLEQDYYMSTMITSYIIYNIIILLLVIGLMLLIRNLFVNSVKDVEEEFDDQNTIIKKMSFRDQLTGLYNRTYFEDVKSKYYPCMKSVGIIMADVDGLKLTNDAFGHAVGDTVLQEVSSILKMIYQDSDLFRWGGDEFIAIVPKTDVKSMNEKAKRFSEEMSKIRINVIKISASLGYYISDGCDEDVYGMIKKAEKMMYDHKIFSAKSIKRTMIDGLLNTLYDSFNFEKQHSQNVMKYSIYIGEALKFSKDQLEKLKLSALLHDIGKISIPDYLLTKKEKLTDEEFREIKLHTEKGHRILSAYPELNEYAIYVLSHHERFDGKGYPQGLSKNDIPLFSRIICVADAFDAMTEDRVYKKKVTFDEALEELINCKGTQFDPKLVDIFVETFKSKNSRENT